MQRRWARRGVPAIVAVGTLLAACRSSEGVAPATSGDGALRAGGLDPVTAPPTPSGSVLDLPVTGWDDAPTTLGAFGGGPMVVNFWASWCGPCVTEMPEFEAVHQEVADRVTFVGVDVIDRRQDGQRMVDRTGVTYALARDPRGELLKAVGGAQMPTTVFVAADGTVAEVVGTALDAKELREQIAGIAP